MFAEKSSLPPSNLHLPPIGKNHRRKIHRPPPSPSFSSKTDKAARISENVSALKAKYADYTTWLKDSTRPNREPVLTQELLKNSLCRMGIDSGKAERLVSTCSWYVYQFQRDLKIDPKEKEKSKKYKNKTKTTTTIIKDNNEDSINSFDQDNSCPANLRNNQFLLPPIHVSDLSTSSRFRRVDFDDEQIKNPISVPSSSTWKSPLNKTRLKPISTESSNHPLPVDFDLSSSQRSSRRHGLVASHARSILRKQTSICSSNTSTEISNQKPHSQMLASASTIKNELPLGTQSKYLFGGSECFAEIMNELEQQNKIL